MYAITGATGNVGKVVTYELLANDEHVLALGRNADKLESLIVKGAVPFVGDLLDLKFVKKAFDGATAVLCIIPTNTRSANLREEQRTIARNFANAVTENGIKYVVLLSSIGAHLRNGAGVIDGLSDMEVYFSKLKHVNVLSLRPTYFMENMLTQAGLIKQMGIMGSPLKGDLKFPMVAAKDVALVAAKRLLDMNFQGHSVEYILGPRDISYNEVSQIIGKAIDRSDLKYVQFSYEDTKKSMVQTGFISENVADLFNAMSEGMNNGKIFSDHRRTPENSTSTDVEDFAKVFAKAYGTSVLVDH